MSQFLLLSLTKQRKAKKKSPQKFWQVLFYFDSLICISNCLREVQETEVSRIWHCVSVGRRRELRGDGVSGPDHKTPHLLSYQIYKTGNNSCYALPEPTVQILITCIISYIPLDFVLCSCGHGQFYKVRNLFTNA